MKTRNSNFQWNRKQLLFYLILIFLIPFQSFSQCGGNIDFSTDWAQKGVPSAGNWTVSNGGATVTQSINGVPTFYVSQKDFIDVKISGTIRVNTSDDDDFVGFVFGFHSPYTSADGNHHKYYLFDWKQLPQSGGIASEEGYRLTKVDSTLDVNNTTDQDLFWHNSTTEPHYPGFNVLGSLTGPAYGWAEFTTYSFTLTYTSDLILITIGNDTIFNVPGCYQGGKFGFYNFSQADVVYSNFSYQLIPNFDFSATNFCINQPIDFNAVNNACFSGGYISPIQSWSWDMGDGTIINDTNVIHTYNKPGVYPVTLTVEDNSGCQTPITKNVVVKGLVAHQNDTVICPSSFTQLWCNLVVPGASYQWFKDGNPVTSPTINDTTYNASLSGNYTVKITNIGGYLCNKTSNAVTITVENKTLNLTSDAPAVCSGTNVNFSVNNISGATYAWYKDGAVIGGETGTSYSSNQTGNYHVKIVSAEGCSYTSNTIPLVSGTKPTASISASVSHFCPGGASTLSTTLQAGESVVWEESGIPIGGATATTFTTSSAGNYTAVVTNSGGCSATSNAINISIDNVPTTSVTQTEPNFCPGVASITLTSNTVSGGSYQWILNGNSITGATSSTYNTAAPGDYQVIITNSLGCIDTSSVATLQNATVSTFTVNISDSTFCDGNSINLSVNNEAGSTYDWYNNSTNVGSGNTFNATNSGSYYAVVTNSLGCSTNSDTSQINVSPLPAASISTGLSSICSGDSTLISATAVPGATYEWFKDGASLGSPILNNNSIYATAIGNYYAVVKNACSNTSNTITISQNLPPDAAGYLKGDLTFCPGETKNFDINSVNGATSYTWTIIPSSAGSIGSGQGTTNITVNTTNQDFTIKVTPTNACGSGGASTKSVTGGDPQSPMSFCYGSVLFAADQTNICKGSTVTFTSYSNSSPQGLIAKWDFGSGASPATATGNGPFNVTYSTSGLKTITLKYVIPWNGDIYDSETKTDYINVAGSVNTSSIVGNNNVSCSAMGETYSVTNTPGSTYNWTVPAGATITSGQGTHQITMNFGPSGGNITVQETVTSGCQGATVTFAVAVVNNVNTSAITGDNSVSCSASGVTYSVTNTTGSTYNWTVPPGASIISGQGTHQITVNFGPSGGNITVQETTTSGCVGAAITFAVAVVSNVNTSAITGDNSVSCSASGITYSVTNTTGSTYNWTVPSGATITSGQGTNSIAVDFNGNTGNITVQETSVGGCTGGVISLTVSCGTLGLNTSKSIGVLKVYPNPVSKQLTIKLPIKSASSIIIYDVEGRVILKDSFNKSSIITLPVNRMKPGLKLGRITTKEAVYRFKFIKR